MRKVLHDSKNIYNPIQERFPNKLYNILNRIPKLTKINIILKFQQNYRILIVRK